MPPTYTIYVPDPQPGIPPGDRWCALSGPRAPLPAILGTADEWLLIAGAIEAGAARAFGRVAFEARIGGGELWSPHNSTGDRDHVRLTTAELVELAADVRAKLAPAVPCPLCNGTRCHHNFGAEVEACARCDGRGTVAVPVSVPNPDVTAPASAPAPHPSDITREAIIARAKACPKADPASGGDDETDIIIAGRQVPFVQVGMIVHPDDCLNCERDGSPLWCSALVCDIHDDDETARFGMMATLLFRNGERREEPCDELRRRWRLARDFDQGRVYTGRWGAIPRGSVWPVAEVNEDA